jgi:hypothetical protein
VQTLTKANDTRKAVQDPKTIAMRRPDEHSAIIGAKIQCCKRRSEHPTSQISPANLRACLHAPHVIHLLGGNKLGLGLNQRHI